MIKLELGDYIILSVYHKGYSINKSSIPNTGVELIFDGSATNINYDLYNEVFRNKGRFTLESYDLDIETSKFKLKSIDCYTGEYRDVLDLLKETQLIIYKQLN
jgi:hypothetical protein